MWQEFWHLILGISSIDWAFSENDELKDCGARIFTKAENPKTGESLAFKTPCKKC